MALDIKICSRCKTEKTFQEFSKNKASLDGMVSSCKKCISQYDKKRYLYLDLKNDESRKAWKSNNKDKINKASRERYKKDPEKYKAKTRLRTVNNPDSVYECSKAWRKANPGYIAQNNRNRRAREIGAEGVHTAADVDAILLNQRGMCANCKTKLVKSGVGRFHIDHVMPLSLGGSNWPYNLQCLCPKCNMSKGAKPPHEFARINGRLL